MTIPWIAVDNNIKQDYIITADLNILNTTATICDIFGIDPHPSYQGKILKEIYV